MCALQSDKKLGIEVNFLTGRYVATFHNQRKQAEWPPHTSRLFSALISAWAEDGKNGEETQALEWLERQRPPDIHAPPATCRKITSHFVPVNDTTIISLKGVSEEKAIKMAQTSGRTSPREAMGLLPEKRKKQERFYPSVTPDETRVTYVWDQTPQDATVEVLDGLLGRVTRLGHSSSLVSCRVIADPPAANYVLSEFGESIRAVRQGQMAELERQYVRHRGFKRRALPYDDARYRKTDEGATPQRPAIPNTSGGWIVFQLEPESRFWQSTQSAGIATAMRETIMGHMDDPIPEEISGTDRNGTPTMDPHVAFMPLPYAGFPHADGRILGIAVSMPRSLEDESRRVLLRAIGKWEDACKGGKASKIGSKHASLKMGDRTIHTSRQFGPQPMVSLRPSTWSRPSRTWISITPIALPRHPGSLSKGSAAARAKAWKRVESAVMSSCEHIGLPRPASMVLSHNPFARGASPSGSYPPFMQKGSGGDPVRRKLVHASLTFKEKVRGPMMLGTGRFAGLGLMRPMPDGDLAR